MNCQIKAVCSYVMQTPVGQVLERLSTPFDPLPEKIFL